MDRIDRTQRKEDVIVEGKTFTVTFKILPGDKGDPPAVHRVRRWLKCSLRSFGLRNEGMKMDDEPDKPPDIGG